MSDMVPVGIRLPMAMHDALRSRADLRGSSLGAEARAAIERDLSVVLNDRDGPRDISGVSEAAEILGVRTGNFPKIAGLPVPAYRKRGGTFYWTDEVVALAERRAAARVAA